MVTCFVFLSHFPKPFFLLSGINPNIKYLYWKPWSRAYFWDNIIEDQIWDPLKSRGKLNDMTVIFRK